MATPLTLDDVMKEIRTSTEITKGVKQDIKKLTTTVKETNTTLENFMEKTEKEIDELKNKSDTVNKRVDDLEEAMTDISDRLTEAENKVKHQEKVIDVLAKKNRQMEEEKKRQNIIIDGIKEDPNKHPRQQVSELLADIDTNIKADDIMAVLRLGSGKTKTTRPRPILVKFANVNVKHELYKNIQKLGDSDKWKHVYVQDDLTSEVQQERKEMRCLAALARERGHNATLKGNALIVDEVKYLYKECGNLPEGINMKNAKLVELEDGWAFQSHHAFCSNMAKCTIRDDGHDYHCSEQLLWYKCAEDAEDQRAMAEVRECESGYAAKRIGYRIKKSNRWNGLRKPTMEKILRKKFDQNEEMKDELINLKGNLYEATTDTFFGAGLTIAQKDKFGSDEQPGDNVLGLQLMKLRDEYLE